MHFVFLPFKESEHLYSRRLLLSHLTHSHTHILSCPSRRHIDYRLSLPTGVNVLSDSDLQNYVQNPLDLVIYLTGISLKLSNILLCLYLLSIPFIKYLYFNLFN